MSNERKTIKTYRDLSLRGPHLRKPVCSVKPGTSRSTPARYTPEKRRVRLCALVEDIDTGRYFADVVFKNVDGKRAHIVLPRSALEHPPQLIRDLLDHGALLSDADKKTLAKLQKQMPTRRRRQTGCCGWHDSTFVLPRESLGKDPTIRFRASNTDHGRGLRKGKKKAWLRRLREPFAASSYLQMMTALSFTVPIAALLEIEETAMFALVGESGSGKTLASKVVESTLGRAREQDLVDLNKTGAGLNDIIGSHNGTILNLNELKTAILTTKGRDLLVMLSHVVTSGSGRDRANLAKQVPELKHHRWCIFGLGNCENPLSSFTKTPRDLGEQARLIEIPCGSLESGGIFDRTQLKGTELRQRTRQLAKMTEKAIEKNYGVAMPRFIKHLLGHKARELKAFTKAVECFVEKAVPDGDSWEQRFARKFGYAYAGGRAALRAGVFPGNKDELYSACRHLYRRARKAVSNPNDMKEDALQQLQRALTDKDRFPMIKKKAGKAKPSPQAQGFRRRFQPAGICLGLPLSLLKSWSGPSYDQLIGDLKTANVVVPGREDELTQVRAIQGKRRRYLILKIAALEKFLVEALRA